MVYNLPYHPEFNPIENFFRIIKTSYKQTKLNSIVTNQKQRTETLLMRSLLAVEKTKIQGICSVAK